MLSSASAIGSIGPNWLRSTWRNSNQSSSQAKVILDNIIGSKYSKAVPLRSVSANVTLESSSVYAGLLQKYRLHNRMKLLSFLGSEPSKVSDCFT